MLPNIVVYSYRNAPVHTARHTNRMYLDEIIGYILGEKLMLGIAAEYELDGLMLQYLSECLDILDRPNVEVIYDEIRKRVEDLSSDLVYQSLLLNGEFYLKYDYHIGKQFTRLQLYVDPSESAWLQW